MSIASVVVSIRFDSVEYMATLTVSDGSMTDDVEGRGETLSESLQDLADSLRERDL